jgi:hypothetical protein
LCWLAMRHGAKRHEQHKWGPLRMMNGPESRVAWSPGKAIPSLNLLSAATHFNLLPLTKRLVAEGHSPTSHNYLFAPPIQVAAQDGNVTMLQFFQAQLPESKLEPCSVTGAAI